MMILLGMGFIALLLYYLQQTVYRKWWNRNLIVSVEFKESSLFEGEEGELVEVIENRKRLPLPMLKVKFQTDRNLGFSDTEGSQVTDQFYRNDVFHIGGGERITRTLTFTGKKRGYYKINGIDVIAADLFLTKSMLKSMETNEYVYVYPKAYQSREFRLSLQQLNGEVLTKRHLLEDPFEYRGIRQYQPYDELRNVNWKATAKTQELKVNQKNYTSLKTIRIFFNIDDTGIWKKTECVEASLQIVAGLAEFFLIQGMRVACYGNGKDIMTGEPLQIEANGGSGQMEHIYKALARVDIKQPTVDFRQQYQQKLLQEGKGVMTFFVAPNSYDDFIDMIREFQDANEDYIWFYPTVEKSPPKIPDELLRNVRMIYI